jgi:hypothetical protein
VVGITALDTLISSLMLSIILLFEKKNFTTKSVLLILLGVVLMQKLFVSSVLKRSCAIFFDLNKTRVN